MGETRITEPTYNYTTYRDLRIDELADLFEIVSRLPNLSERDRERLKLGVENLRKWAVMKA